jgi:Tol biopolymer transport system component
MKSKHLSLLLFVAVLGLVSCSPQRPLPLQDITSTSTQLPKPAEPTSTLTPLKQNTPTSTLTPSPTATETPAGILKNFPTGEYIVYYSMHLDTRAVSTDGKRKKIIFAAEDGNATCTLSPDNTKIAQSRDFYNESKTTIFNLYNGLIREIKIPGCSPSDNPPAWSPDGTEMAISCDDNRIAIISVVDDEFSIQSYLMIDDDVVIYDPAWSPDGNYISFYIFQPDAFPYSYPTSGPYISEIGCYKNNRECKLNPILLRKEGKSRWTPDGFLAVAQETTLFLFDPATKRIEETIDIPLKDSRIESFAWSPDGQWIAFSASWHTSPPGIYTIFIIPSHDSSKPIVVDSTDGDLVLFWLIVNHEQMQGY